jgi:hypothetical protein
MNIIGIDPGKGGGIAWFDDRGRPCVEAMPDTLKDLADFMRDIRDSFEEPGTVKAYLEQVASSPQMGVVSAFTFGNGFGHLEMGLVAHGIPFERVRPQVWQKAMGCLSKGDKNITKRRAQELFPDCKVTHKTADALLIAEYGRRLQLAPKNPQP